MRHVLLLAAAATVSLAGVAMAQTPPGRPPGDGPGLQPADRMKMIDVNTDGFVDKSEWHGTPERFEIIDTNKDGKITLAELAAAPPPPPRNGPGGGPPPGH